MLYTRSDLLYAYILSVAWENYIYDYGDSLSADEEDWLYRFYLFNDTIFDNGYVDWYLGYWFGNLINLIQGE